MGMGGGLLTAMGVTSRALELDQRRRRKRSEPHGCSRSPGACRPSGALHPRGRRPPEPVRSRCCPRRRRRRRWRCSRPIVRRLRLASGQLVRREQHLPRGVGEADRAGRKLGVAGHGRAVAEVPRPRQRQRRRGDDAGRGRAADASADGPCQLGALRPTEGDRRGRGLFVAS
jgi:hypothetical protein